MTEIDTLLFVEIILCEGVKELGPHDFVDEVCIQWYLGLNGQKVPISLTQEFLTSRTAIEYLEQLGLADLIGRIPLEMN